MREMWLVNTHLWNADWINPQRTIRIYEKWILYRTVNKHRLMTGNARLPTFAKSGFIMFNRRGHCIWVMGHDTYHDVMTWDPTIHIFSRKADGFYFSRRRECKHQEHNMYYIEGVALITVPSVSFSVLTGNCWCDEHLPNIGDISIVS